MEQLSNATLGRIRTPAQALTELVAKYRRLVANDPQRPMLARMIDQLEIEIAQRGGVVFYAGGDFIGASGPVPGGFILGLC